MEDHHGKWRFTSPTHVVQAFAQALAELEQEGGGVRDLSREKVSDHDTFRIGTIGDVHPADVEGLLGAVAAARVGRQ